MICADLFYLLLTTFHATRDDVGINVIYLTKAKQSLERGERGKREVKERKGTKVKTSTIRININE
ncbi:MAG: hypothetical protein FWH55_13765 [Oscillospiraceae bacterium]|nr:hypothetical protein [Oscillospiraceae bacterium]